MAGGALVTALTLLIAIVGVWYAAKTYLIGWREYLGFCETPSVLRELDQWIRRRLRAIVWKQWKSGPTRFAKLRRCGVGPVLAAQAAGSPRGPWRLSNSPRFPWLYRTPYSNRSALQLSGVQSLIHRTAVYGPVRTVVWEGRSREAPPYPDQ